MGLSTYRVVLTFEPLEDRRLFATTSPDLAEVASAAAAYVRGGTHAGSNYGNSTELAVKRAARTSDTREAYLTFRLPAGDPVPGGKLRLYGRLNEPGSVALNVFSASNTSWDESSLTWNNKPARDSTVRGDLTVTGSSPAWYEVDLSDFLKAEQAAGRGEVTLVLAGAANTNAFATFASDEAAANAPQLVLDGQTDPAPPPTSGGGSGATTVTTGTTSYVRGGTYAGANYGGSPELMVKRSGTQAHLREAYLKFSLSSVGSVSSGKLRLYGGLNEAGSITLNVFSASNTSWSESTLTWNNKPASGSTLRGSFVVSGSSSKWYEVDLTGFLKAEKAAGRNTVTLVLKGAANTNAFATFASDEASANAPQLVLNGSTTSTPDLAAQQRAFLEQKYGMFIHFGYNTFTDSKATSPNVDHFNPSNLNTDQWAAVAKASGMKYGVFTAKHHTGYALWDSGKTTFDVASSAWYRRETAAGRSGDVVRRYVDSFRAQGLGVGLYYSIWDEHADIDALSDPARATAHVKAEITELLTKYGPIQLLWTDGWGWKVGFDAVDWDEVYAHIKSVSPNTLLVENSQEFTLAHSDVVVYERPITGTVPSGNTLPAEVADTIRADGSWHYRTYDPAMNSVDTLVSRGKTANARGANYLLNVGPDLTGAIPQKEVDTLRQVEEKWFG